MELEVSVDNEQQFWTNIQEIVSAPCSSEDLIDNALRAYLNLAAQYKEEYLQSEFEVARCSFKLLSSTIFVAHSDYVRRQMIYALLQEDDPVTLHMIASFLLFDGRQHEFPLQMMNEEGAFPRLLELLHVRTLDKDHDSGAGLHRLLMDLLYELSRIQKIKIEDLILVDDEFVRGLFNIIENLSFDANDPYHYPVIRVLLVLNEQFMISAHNPSDGQSPSNPLTNKVIKVLSMHGNSYKTFGENIILLINREAETSLQLLTLKLLYLIFTTPSTYEYFFTNDLHVLVDILIRNLLDLPEEASALRHTYLRVLYPLVAHTQLRLPPHYKRDELKRMLNLLVRGQLTSNTTADCEKITHFGEVDETTRRLVLRCATVDWLRDEEEPYKPGNVPQREDSLTSSLPTIDSALVSDVEMGTSLESLQSIESASTRGSSLEDLSFPRADGRDSPASASGTPRKHSQVARLGMHLDPASTSSLSVHEVASQREKPGIITPSRHDGHQPERQSSPTKQKVKPLPPKTRRWRGRRATVDEGTTSPVATASIAEEGSTITGPNSPSLLSATPVITTSEPVISDPERRNSSAVPNPSPSHIPPAPPAHHHPLTRRSASNPPPAVPPPRRSGIQNNLSSSSHCTPLTSPSRLATPQGTQAQTHKQAQKPEPPKTRRSGRKHTQTDSSDTSQVSQSGNSISSMSSAATTFLHPEYLVESPSSTSAAAAVEDAKITESGMSGHEQGQEHAVVSVEEAVQNVSLH
ncbi:hypothetical protein ASPVEDRAFT_42039 [Aspergillus versicolor CBS 583.65]|uniref:SPIN90/Ldb17 leucine-rich domain-containing protein n=1 Tax=Aspergillus versicolor CBS 583.65 TaxID=1036611 RepID=A0A1L9PM99_ASPVE|nr:uncharacterized protein ASPVEDRAFT_42039 [Aspergillus versicolor CBS 583.65]OJJ02545.1 hypothetical protein ASPVEDRAFT_42039 [Aspergillus versicolor CBS 583.65]